MTKGVSGFAKNDESFIFCNFLASSSTLSSKSVFELLDSNDGSLRKVINEHD